MPKIEDLNLKERIYTAIRDRIFDREFLPDEKLPELKLAEEFGVSRTIIREAIRRLSWDGLIHIEPNRASTVIQVDEKTIQELILIRWQHDRLAIPLVTYRASREDLNQLRSVAESCIAANDIGDLSSRHDLDIEFHRGLYRLSGNELLCILQDRLNLLVRLWQSQHISDPATLAEGLYQHLELLDLLEAGNTDGALRVIQAHAVYSFGSDFTGTLLTPDDLFNLQRADP